MKKIGFFEGLLLIVIVLVVFWIVIEHFWRFKGKIITDPIACEFALDCEVIEKNGKTFAVVSGSMRRAGKDRISIIDKDGNEIFLHYSLILLDK